MFAEVGDVVRDVVRDVVGEVVGEVVGDVVGDVVGNRVRNVVGEVFEEMVGEVVEELVGAGVAQVNDISNEPSLVEYPSTTIEYEPFSRRHSSIVLVPQFPQSSQPHTSFVKVESKTRRKVSKLLLHESNLTSLRVSKENPAI